MVILAGLAAALVWEAWVTGVIIDGPSHLLSAHLYWRGADRLEPGDMPPLIKLAAGWVPGFFHPPVPYDHPIWATQHEWLISGEMMQMMTGPQIHTLFFFSRLPLLIFPLLTALLVWHWGRQLFGPWVGVLLSLLFALEPTALGHLDGEDVAGPEHCRRHPAESPRRSSAGGASPDEAGSHLNRPRCNGLAGDEPEARTGRAHVGRRKRRAIAGVERL